MSGETSAPRARRVAALAALYLIWGSTYLAIAVGIETIPPFLLAGARSVSAGALLVGWAWIRGAERPTARQWRAAWIAGALFFLVGHGGLFWAEQRVATGLAALVQATIPLWMVLLAWMRPGGAAPTRRVMAGVALGLAGIALLSAGGEGAGGVDPVGFGVLLLSALSWVVASFYFRGERRPRSSAFAAGMPLLTGGTLLFAASAATGEPARFHAADVTAGALLALGYLVLFGSIIGFTAFTWLVTVETPARAGSYAYVNPLVALALGWAFLGETVTARVVLAAGIVIVSVALVVTGGSAPRRPFTGERPPSVERRSWRGSTSISLERKKGKAA